MFGLFKKKEPQQIPQADSEERKELKEIWDSLDQELKDFAKAPCDLGLRVSGRSAWTRLNEVGMANLVKQLNDIGYEIRPKEESEHNE